MLAGHLGKKPASSVVSGECVCQDTRGLQITKLPKL